MPATFNFRPYTMPYATGVGRHLHDGVVVSHPSHFQLRGKREDDWNHRRLCETNRSPVRLRNNKLKSHNNREPALTNDVLGDVS